MVAEPWHDDDPDTLVLNRRHAETRRHHVRWSVVSAFYFLRFNPEAPSPEVRLSGKPSVWQTEEL